MSRVGLNQLVHLLEQIALHPVTMTALALLFVAATVRIIL